MGANNMEALAEKSIEQITQEALDEANAGEAAGGAEAKNDAGDAGAAKQDVLQASSGQADGQGEDKVESDKDKNFAALRTKNKHLADDLAAAQAEIDRLAAAKSTPNALPEEYAQKVSEVDAQLASIGEKFQEGDLTWEDYQTQLREATAQRENLVREAAKAETTQEISERERQREIAEAQAAWDKASDAFIAAKPDSIDYAADTEKFRDLNTYVKALAADPDNGNKPADWYLQEAHSLVKAKHRIASAPAAASKPSAPATPSAPALPFNSLGEVPGGVLPANTEVEQLDQVSGAALSNRFLNDPKAIDKALASLS